MTQAAERGVQPQVIDAVFKAFEPFERYGFNKAHATCYGLIAYQTAYLKANYTVEYMTSVLTAFRDIEREGRGRGGRVPAPGHRGPPAGRPQVGPRTSRSRTTPSASACWRSRTSARARSSRSSRRATRAATFRSLADFCARVDLRLVNRRVLESLIKVGALSRFGHPAQLLLALDDAMAAGQAVQRDRISGQTSLFDIGADAGDDRAAAAPDARRRRSRERLRWEKELLGLYLSDHPLGDIAEPIGRFVTAYSGDLGEELDQQRVVVGGVVTGVRTVVTKARATMAVATLEDLQGSLEVVVFPKTLEATAGAWRADAIVLVAGRVDHKGDETVLLADAVWDWDAAEAMGEAAFARVVAEGDRGRRGGRGANGFRGAGSGYGNGNGPSRPAGDVPDRGEGRGPRVAVGPGLPAQAPATRTIPHVSPLRGGGVLGTIEIRIGGGGAVAGPPMPRPRPTPPLAEPPEPRSITGLDDDREEPPLPDEARRAVTATLAPDAPTLPETARPGQVLQVRFARADEARLVEAFEALRAVVAAHPGETPVVLHLPAPGGQVQPMQLRTGVAFDAELVAELHRRIGAIVTLELA